MAESNLGYTLKQLAEMVGGELEGPEDFLITRPVPAHSDDPSGVTFAESEKYLGKALAGSVGAVIVPAETGSSLKPLIRVASPRLAFGMVLHAFAKPMPARGIDPTAVVSDSANVDPTASIGAYAVVEDGATIGAGTNILAHAYIGPDCHVGANCMIFSHVTLVQDVQVGEGCRIHAGAVLGADGFGFYWDGSRQQKVPQVGGVIVGKNVEIGAHTCIDRATCGDTIIQDGVKLDNLVQIGHNTVVGSHTVMAAQVGTSGSVTIGEKNVFGGQAALSDHVTTGDNMIFGGRSGVIGDMDQPGEYFGLPPVPLSTAMRVMALQARLPELYKRMREMERQIEELKNGS
ncbi:UDP-3-O-(3-hydroxymyristoyl)glucosamine N-acyltransferase [bacterium]|jgi:UDP-3-O-[3-hydroxymyristoyl] glucosamine N-acyltransferase|nr:UDP-3-O-(3-hydroxymyristoyl)glucosamine N-acyltransferase [bacterium]